jgi:hypothetical protein
VLHTEISLSLQLHHCTGTLQRVSVPSPPSPSFVGTLHQTQSVDRSDPVLLHTVTVTGVARGILGGYAVLVEEIVLVRISYVRTLQEKI